MAKCICVIHGDTGSSHSSSVYGVLRLNQQSEDAPTIIEGEIRGLSPGKHGISVNVFGDLSNASASCGVIFNPFGKLMDFPTSGLAEVIPFYIYYLQLTSSVLINN
jgi:Cu-Zn family superoxide dismutase